MKPGQHIIRRMGYRGDQEGIMSRYLRVGDCWNEHLENTRLFIMESFPDPAIESVAVLGSGWLLDVPLEAMTRRFSRIVLADIRHPAQVRRKVQEMKNVELVETDLTGGAVEFIWRITRERGRVSLEKIIHDMELRSPAGLGDPDALVSVNLMNQLDILLCDHMRGKGYFQHDRSDAFRKAIQQFHIAWITSHPGCLVTDTMEINRDRNGNETVNQLLYTDLPPGTRSRNWKWEFDIQGTYQAGTQTRMEVQAIEWI